MRKICIINQKGGVGKTTTTVSVAAGLARNGKRVLVIDLDPQGNIATCISEDNNQGMFEFLIQGSSLGACITHMGKNLDLLTSKENLHKAEFFIMKKDDPLHFMAFLRIPFMFLNNKLASCVLRSDAFLAGFIFETNNASTA